MSMQTSTFINYIQPTIPLCSLVTSVFYVLYVAPPTEREIMLAEVIEGYHRVFDKLNVKNIDRYAFINYAANYLPTLVKPPAFIMNTLADPTWTQHMLSPSIVGGWYQSEKNRIYNLYLDITETIDKIVKEMSDWYVHDFATQNIMNSLVSQGINNFKPRITGKLDTGYTITFYKLGEV